MLTDSMKMLELSRDIVVATINNSPDKDVDAICKTLEKVYAKLIALLGNRTEGK